MASMFRQIEALDKQAVLQYFKVLCIHSVNHDKATTLWIYASNGTLTHPTIYQ